MLDLEASPVQGQLSSAVLDLQGNLLRGPLPQQEAVILYQMLVEAGNLNDMSDFSRLTVTFPTSVRYVITRDQKYIYIVQTRMV